MATCDHVNNFAANVQVDRILDSSVWYANLTVTCSDCGMKAAFLGVPMGLSPTGPHSDIAGTELRLPFKAYDEAEARRRLMMNGGASYQVLRPSSSTEGT